MRRLLTERFSSLILRDNVKIVVLYYLHTSKGTDDMFERIREIIGRNRLMELPRSAEIWANVFPEFKPTLMNNHTSNTMDKILTIIVGLVFFISFQALVLANCPLFSWTNFEAALKSSS